MITGTPISGELIQGKLVKQKKIELSPGDSIAYLENLF